MERIISDMFNRPLNNDIDNVKKRLNNNVNDNDNVARNSKQVDAIADRLMEKLGTTNYREFYCKVAWRLPEAQIFSNLEIALKGNNPQRYFTWLCKRQMQ